MGVEVHVTDDEVMIGFSDLERVLALSGGLRLRIDEVTDARVAPIDEVRDGLGLRVGGGYFPGWFATGHFMVPGRKGARQLWCVFRDAEVLVIDTTRQSPCRVVLQHPDRDFLAWIINERVHRAH